MNLLNLSVTPFIIGLAVLAGLLFILQRLRVKFNEQEVVTTLFWKQAVEETRAHVLMRRFRHPLAYLLALLIAALVWLAFAEPDWNRDKEADTVFLLDGSAGMGWGDRFEQAKEILRSEADRIPAARRRVYFCGADARLILDRGEEISLLEPRLVNLVPEASPSSIERSLRALAVDETSAPKLNLLVVGDAPVSEAGVAGLPESAYVVRLRGEETPTLESNNGIAAVGVADAASGAFDRVDVMIETLGAAEEGLTLALGGQPLEQAPMREGQTYTLRDVPTRGEVLEVALVGEDNLPVDNRARITLPDRRTVPVALDENLDSRFLALVEADPAFVAATEAAEIVIGGASDGALPAIELVTGNGIAVVYEADLDTTDLEEMRARFAATGLDRVGWTLTPGSEREGAFQLAPRYVPGPKRKIQIGNDLLSVDYDFLEASAFPLFVSSALRWLADVPPPEPFAVAGERSMLPGRFILAGSDYAPPRSGEYLDANGQPFEVALAAIASPERQTLTPVTRSTNARGWPSLISGCILLALFLIGAEWWLFQKGRIP